MAYNTLVQRRNVIDHTSILDRRLKRVKVFNRISEVLLRYALPVSLIFSFTLMLVLLVFLIINSSINKKVSSKRVVIVRLIKIKKENRTLKRELKEAKGLVERRIDKARILELAAKSIPKNTWLTEFRIKGNVRPRLKLEGVSKKESGISRMYSNLEKTEEFKDVRLTYTERISRKEIARTSRRLFGGTLVRFGIEMNVK